VNAQYLLEHHLDWLSVAHDAGTPDGCIMVHDLQSGALLQRVDTRMRGHAIRHLSWSHDSEQLAAAIGPGAIFVYRRDAKGDVYSRQACRK
jgi:hypothetical protein